MSQVFAIVFVADIVFLLVRSQRSLVEIINNKKSKIFKRVKVFFAKRGLGTPRPSILPSGLGLQNPHPREISQGMCFPIHYSSWQCMCQGNKQYHQCNAMVKLFREESPKRYRLIISSLGISSNLKNLEYYLKTSGTQLELLGIIRERSCALTSTMYNGCVWDQMIAATAWRSYLGINHLVRLAHSAAQ